MILKTLKKQIFDKLEQKKYKLFFEIFKIMQITKVLWVLSNLKNLIGFRLKFIFNLKSFKKTTSFAFDKIRSKINKITKEVKLFKRWIQQR